MAREAIDNRLSVQKIEWRGISHYFGLHIRLEGRGDAIAQWSRAKSRIPWTWVPIPLALNLFQSHFIHWSVRVTCLLLLLFLTSHFFSTFTPSNSGEANKISGRKFGSPVWLIKNKQRYFLWLHRIQRICAVVRLDFVVLTL